MAIIYNIRIWKHSSAVLIIFLQVLVGIYLIIKLYIYLKEK